MDKRSIGVFDSGLGGLTVVKELRKLMPSEHITYFGDTARVPYGSKNPQTILSYAYDDIRFLLSRDVKAIIVACGTASTVLTAEALEAFSLPMITVIEPTAEAAVKCTKTGRIGVIGTSATVRSGAFERSLRAKGASLEIFSKACPLFVPLVENGYIEKENPALRYIIEDYLTEIRAANIDTLILGCTHYPILASAIADFMGDSVTLVSSGVETAKYAKAMLLKQQLQNESGTGGTAFYVSDHMDAFTQVASLFLEEQINTAVQQVRITDYAREKEGK